MTTTTLYCSTTTVNCKAAIWCCTYR